jgi:hypothetical protein
VDLLALMIASFTLPAVVGAVVVAVAGYLLWGWIGTALGVVVGYGTGVWFNARFVGVPLSPHVKGWLSLALFLAGLTVLAIVTR